MIDETTDTHRDHDGTVEAQFTDVSETISPITHVLGDESDAERPRLHVLGLYVEFSRRVDHHPHGMSVVARGHEGSLIVEDEVRSNWISA